MLQSLQGVERRLLGRITDQYNRVYELRGDVMTSNSAYRTDALVEIYDQVRVAKGKIVDAGFDEEGSCTRLTVLDMTDGSGVRKHYLRASNGWVLEDAPMSDEDKQYAIQVVG